jgi:hypothetical protein
MEVLCDNTVSYILAIHLFETSSGKPVGDGKPIQHSVIILAL